ncbi:hypothetical protein ILFOPFJJ_06730 [Ensifer psoraleae]|nr:hypothetical protein [Sinorhizobium psoraleae]
MENPYFQYLCGEEFFRHDLPFDRSSMTRWRGRMGEARLTALLQESLAVAVKSGAMQPQDTRRVIVDSTVQPKNVMFPTDAKLIHRARERLVRLAKKTGVTLRQTYLRVGKLALIKHQRYAHAKQFKRADLASVLPHANVTQNANAVPTNLSFPSSWVTHKISDSRGCSRQDLRVKRTALLQQRRPSRQGRHVHLTSQTVPAHRMGRPPFGGRTTARLPRAGTKLVYKTLQITQGREPSNISGSSQQNRPGMVLWCAETINAHLETLVGCLTMSGMSQCVFQSDHVVGKRVSRLAWHVQLRRRTTHVYTSYDERAEEMKHVATAHRKVGKVWGKQFVGGGTLAPPGLGYMQG